MEDSVKANIDPQSHFLLALCLTQLKNLDRALGAWDEAIKRQPSSIAGSYNKGLTYVLKDQWELALPQLEKATLLDPAGAHELATPSLITADPACQLLLGGCRIFSGDLERAWQHFDSVIEADASREEAYALRGFVRLLQANSTAAIADLGRSRKAIDLKLLGDGFMSENDPKRALHYYLLAQKMQADLDLAAAIKAAQDAPSTPPALPPRPGVSKVQLGSSRGVRPPDSPLRSAILAEVTDRLAKSHRLKQEAQQLVVWQWRKVMFGEEELIGKVPYDIVRLGTTLLRDHLNVR